MPIETQVFDAAPYYPTEEDRAELLAEAFETGEVGFIVQALLVVARAKGLTAVAEAAGITRQGLGKALGEGGNPTLSTLMGVARALGFRLTVVPIAAE